MGRAYLAALLVCIAALGGGCGASRRPPDDPVPPGERTTTLRVDNGNFYDMRIYLVDGGRLVRLGVVRRNGFTELAIPAALARDARQLEFFCEPIDSGRAPVTLEIPVRPGERLTLVIPNSWNSL